ncbi:hypothetical protein [Streptomyces sp. NBC_01285]|uniref:hypothetical protein n=1 Tax=Streptomyces sp. NBC_01285 TaxID=2903813 RepID=UPI0022590492|nr:hypothetical protein [Streptomyces sp. NBC_01285]
MTVLGLANGAFIRDGGTGRGKNTPLGPAPDRHQGHVQSIRTGQRSSVPSVRAGGVVNAVACAGGASVRSDVGCCRFGMLVGFVPAETDVSVMPVSSQVSVVLGAFTGTVEYCCEHVRQNS